MRSTMIENGEIMSFVCHKSCVSCHVFVVRNTRLLTIVRARTSNVATTIVMIAIYPGSGGTGWGSGSFVMSLAIF